MYFPYLRGKQFELVALNELRNFIQTDGRIIPILEPVKKDCQYLISKLRPYVENNLPIIIICNPIVGELRSNPNKIIDEVIPILDTEGTSHILGYIISESTTITDVENFIHSARNHNISFIHCHEFENPQRINNIPNVSFNVFIEDEVDTSYHGNFQTSQNIIIKDGFKLKQKNALYPNEENYYDLNLTYRRDGYEGFGDYLIIGKEYKENGGPAHAVVIHMTYIKTSGSIGIKHFVSDRTTTRLDIPGKFYEAVTKLINDFNTHHQILNTYALQRYQELYVANHYPGLGEVKKLSMEHHIELISHVI
jgi:hypothetical protein